MSRRLPPGVRKLPSGRYQATLWLPDGTRTTRSDPLLKVVTTWQATQRAALAHGQWVDPKAGRVRLGEYMRGVWLPGREHQPQTRALVEADLRRYVDTAPPEGLAFGEQAMASVLESTCRAWQSSLTSRGGFGLAASTANRVSGYVRAAFALAVRDRVIAADPWSGVRRPTVGTGQVDPPDVDEVRRIVAAATSPLWGAMMHLDATTGMRIGELRGLSVDRVDFLRRTATVDRQVIRRQGRLVWAPLKGQARPRTVPLPRHAVDVLAAYLAEHPAAVGEWAGLVFHRGDAPVGYSGWDHAVKAACRRAGTVGRNGHQLRHHYATVLIEAGMSPRAVQHLLGHKDVMTTLRIYHHVWESSPDRAREVVETAWDSGIDAHQARTGPVENTDSGG